MLDFIFSLVHFEFIGNLLTFSTEKMLVSCFLSRTFQFAVPKTCLPPASAFRKPVGLPLLHTQFFS